MISILANTLLFKLPTLLAQVDTETTTRPLNPLVGLVCGLIGLLITVIIIAAVWKVFTKAGQPGWASIIPIYNIYILCKVAGRPGWWLLLLCIPGVNFVIGIIVGIDVAKNFGKGAGFGVGLALLGFIFFPILGFGSATYQGTTPPAL